MSEIFYTRHNGGATLFMDGRLKTVSNDHPNFDKILQALKDRKFDLVHQLMDIVGTVNKFGSNVSKKFANRKVFVENGQVYFTDANGKKTELHGTLVDRILEDLGKPQAQKYADALLALQDNIMQNKIKDIREELYEFLMSGKTPITMDGCFLAYKKVRAPNAKGEYLDIYTGTIDNAPGKIPRMDESKVDTDRNRTCSRGLHFCSKGYLNHYSDGNNGNVVVVVKVNPKHVFAIPTDYSFQKGRASEYYVVGVTKQGWDPSIDAFKDSFIDEDTKETAAPHVTFAGPLRAGLEKMAESYGIVKDGKALVIERHGVYVPVKEAGTKYVDIIGTPVIGQPKLMAFETKSVRAAVKAAVQKAQGSQS